MTLTPLLLLGACGSPTNTQDSAHVLPPEPPAGRLLIEELYYAGSPPEAGTDHYFSDQFIELVNISDAPVEVGGLLVGDVYGVSGAINPVVAEFVSTEIKDANATQEALIIIRMDTPGGLDTSMRQIIKSIQTSKIPVATFVAPSGSRAASAGTFITIASHIAAMAPGTNIGAAHPVNLMGGGKEGDPKEPTPMEEKILNDASAYIRSLAEARGRNAYWAEQAVRKSVSISAEEAKKLAVIDLIANNVEALVLAVMMLELDRLVRIR